MINETMATYANYALYSAVAVLMLAMIGYGVYLAALVPDKDAAREAKGAERASAKPPKAVESASAAGGSGAGTTTLVREDTDAPEETSLRGRKAAGMAGTLAWLGTALLLVSGALRAASVQRAPLANVFEFTVTASFFVMAAFCIWSLRRDLRWMGLFVTAPVVLFLWLAGTVWYTEAAELVPSLQSFWLVVHVSVAVAATALCVLSAILSGLYLIRDSAVGQRGFWVKFPKALPLERLSYGMIIVAFPLWTFALISGAIWARQAWASYWNWDPKEVWTFVIWIVYAAYLHARATTTVSRRTANWINLAGFVCIIINFTVVNYLFVGQHSYAMATVLGVSA